MFAKKRYISVLPISINCKKLNTQMTFDYVFSGVYDEISSNTFSLQEINPHKTLGILSPGAEIQIYIYFKDSNYVAKGTIKEIEEEKVIVEINKDKIDSDKRQFYRFHFCCEDLGMFTLTENDIVIDKEVCIYEVSKTGIGLYVPADVSLKVGNVYNLEQEKTNMSFTIQVVHIKTAGKLNVVGSKIIKTNVNLLKYILQEYIKVSEKLIVG